MPEFSKDVMIGILGAAVGLAGLLLVVAGYVFSQVNGFNPATTDDALIGRYETAAKLGLVPFILALCDAALCLAWLIHCSTCIFSIAVGGFFLLLVLTAIYGSVLILRYL